MEIIIIHYLLVFSNLGITIICDAQKLFEHICSFSFRFYALHKNKIGRDDFDDTSILMAKDSYEENLQELRDFIEKRSAESWK